MNKNLFHKILQIAGNVKLGVTYLIILALLSVLGSTYIKQGEPYITYAKEFGNTAAKIIWITWLNDVFHAWYYQLLIVLVAIAVIASTIERFPKIYLSAYGKFEKKMTEGLLKKPSTIHTKTTLSIEEAVKAIAQLLHDKGFKKVEKVAEEEDAVYLFAEKGRISRWGMLVTHIGIIVFLTGAFIGSVFGIRGQIEIPEGEIRDYFYKFRQGSLSPSDEAIKLPFAIKLNKFWLDYYDNPQFQGAVKSFNSQIEILKNNKKVMETVVKVNHPVEYEGYRIFQASYGKTGDIKSADIVVVEFDKILSIMERGNQLNQKLISEKDEDKKAEYEKQLRDLQREIDEYFTKAPRIKYTYGQEYLQFQGIQMKVLNQTLNYKNPMLVNQDIYDPIIVVEFLYNGKDLRIPIIGNPTVALSAFEKFGYSQGFKYLMMIEKVEPRYFSGLQISNFPGTNLIWIGTVIIVFGTMLAFYTVHRRVWVKIQKDGNIYIALYSQKFKESFEESIKESLNEYLR